MDDELPLRALSSQRKALGKFIICVLGQEAAQLVWERRKPPRVKSGIVTVEVNPRDVLLRTVLVLLPHYK